MHSGTVVGKLEGDREATLGWVDQMREPFIPENRKRGLFFDQDWKLDYWREGLLVDLTTDLRNRRPAYLGLDDPADGSSQTVEDPVAASR